MTVDRVINNNEWMWFGDVRANVIGLTLPWCGAVYMWMWFGDVRANVIEPQLGYALRSLEHNLQRGLGCGHGLLVVLQIVKP
jgi:hypothetical protein